MSLGPISGLKVIEFGGIGPAPFSGMLLSDMGADVIRIEKPGVSGMDGMTGTKFQLDARGRRSVSLDLKSPEGRDACLDLIEKADILIEGNRPGVMEKLGLGPDIALDRNPALIYGRMTGWGQTGPLAKAAGHDFNFLSISGILNAIGTRERVVPPLTILGNYGGGLVFTVGLLAGMLHARETGEGQVVDGASSDACAYIGTIFYALHGAGLWNSQRESNLLDGGAPFVNVYRCVDDRWISIACPEPEFYALLLDKLELKDILAQDQWDQSSWPTMKETIAEKFASKTRQEWSDLLEGTNVCFAPVLSLDEAPAYHHNRARNTFVELDGVVQPAPVPRFSITPGEIQRPPPTPGTHTREVFVDWGIDEERINSLIAADVI